jgi:exopolyphosphatase/guanosine-5'-triphosphate,3'-diphosphate pyrophosphatase
MWAHADRRPRDAAVIDVGSNSVRLVIYRLEGRAIWTVFNEKVLAGLGRGMASTGRLAPEGAEAALNALKRFKAVLDASRPSQTFVAATAAIREASDGDAFVHRTKRETGLTIRVLSGAEEARYAALGVLAGTPDADGVVGDLGGSSLELTKVSGGQPGTGITLPLGAFSIRGADGFDADRVRAQTARVLADVSPDFAADTLYAVGGSFRNLALLQMQIAGYPLQIVHQYELPAQEALDAARFIARQSRGSLEGVEGISKRRFDTLPHAAIVLEGLIERLGFKRVSVSAYGLREGLLFESMSREVRALDPLIEGCAALGARQGAAEDFARELEAWLRPAFSTLEPVFGTRDAVLINAACRLADHGARLHPDHRADLVFEEVLRAPVAGLNHPERAFLALTLFARYTGSPNTPGGRTLGRVLGPDGHRRARALGAALRLGCDISGRSGELLKHARLIFENGNVVLIADPAWADMLLGEQTAKRASALAGQLDMGLRLGR